MRHLDKGMEVKLRRYNDDSEFFDPDGYMWQLGWKKDRTYIIKRPAGNNLYELKATPEEPNLESYVWRREDLLVVGYDISDDPNEPNRAFLRKKRAKRNNAI